jgi:hypothetical protein
MHTTDTVWHLILWMFIHTEKEKMGSPPMLGLLRFMLIKLAYYPLRFNPQPPYSELKPSDLWALAPRRSGGENLFQDYVSALTSHAARRPTKYLGPGSIPDACHPVALSRLMFSPMVLDKTNLLQSFNYYLSQVVSADRSIDFQFPKICAYTSDQKFFLFNSKWPTELSILRIPITLILILMVLNASTFIIIGKCKL